MPQKEVEREGPVRARLTVEGRGNARVETGITVLDHLLGIVAEYGCFDLTLELGPGAASDQVGAAGTALGEILRPALQAEGARGHGSSMVPSDEALASVSLDVSERPLVFSNVDLSSVHVAGLGTDLVAGFLEALARSAGLNLHVRLVEGDDEQHVLEAIFKALGSALGRACERLKRRRRTK